MPPGTSTSESCPGSVVRSTPCASFLPLALGRPSCCGRPPGPPCRPARPPRRSLPSLARVFIARIPGTRRVLGGPGVLGAVGVLEGPSVLGAVGVLEGPSVLGAVGVLEGPSVLGAVGVLGGPSVLGRVGVPRAVGARDAFLGAIDILDLVGQEGREVGQLI